MVVVSQPGWTVPYSCRYDVVDERLVERTGRSVFLTEGEVFPPVAPGKLGYIWAYHDDPRTIGELGEAA